jgi:hypothetical protein
MPVTRKIDPLLNGKPLSLVETPYRLRDRCCRPCERTRSPYPRLRLPPIDVLIPHHSSPTYRLITTVTQHFQLYFQPFSHILSQVDNVCVHQG